MAADVVSAVSAAGARQGNGLRRHRPDEEQPERLKGPARIRILHQSVNTPMSEH